MPEEETKKEEKEESDDVVYDNDNDSDQSDQIQKIKKLKKEIESVKKEKTDLLFELQKAKADFINMRKRDEDHLRDMVKFAGSNIISDLIPVLDSFDMAFSNKEAWEKAPKDWRVGVEYIFNQLHSVLQNNGVTVIDKIGVDFDTSLHEAVENVEVEKKDDHKIIAVIQKGYKLGDRLIRPAKVKVGISK